MSKIWKIAIAGTAALVLIIAAPGFTGAQKKRATAPSNEADLARAMKALEELDTRELEKLSAELENKLQRVQEQLARKMAELQSLDSIAVREQLAQAERQAELAAELVGQHAELAGEQAKLAAELAGQEVEAGKLAHLLDRAALAGQEATAWVIDSDGDGWLGVNVSEVSAEKAKELKLPAERGVVINDVEADSAAGKAGLKSGDVVTEFNGQRVEGTAQFRRMIRETPAGRSVTLTVWRDGKSQQISVTLGSQRDRATTLFRERAKPLASDSYYFELPRLGVFGAATPTLGVQIEDLSGQLGVYFGAPDGEGVLVKHVHSGTPAERAGMKAGDVITKIDGERVRTSSDMRSRLRELREKDSVTLGVLRKGAETSLKVELEKPKSPERKTAARRYRL